WRDLLVVADDRVHGIGQGVDYVVEVGDLGARDAVLVAERQPLRSAAGGDDGDDLGVEEVRVLVADAAGGVPLVAEQVVAAAGLEQDVEVLPGVREDVDPAVGGALRPAVGRQDAGIAGRSQRRAGNGAGAVLDERERLHDVDHRDLDALAAPGALAAEQGGGDRIHDRDATDLVGADR